MKHFSIISTLLLAALFLQSCFLLPESVRPHTAHSTYRPPGQWSAVEDDRRLIQLVNQENGSYIVLDRNSLQGCRLEIVGVEYEYNALFWYIQLDAPDTEFDRVRITTGSGTYTLRVEEHEKMSDFKNGRYLHQFYGQVDDSRKVILQQIMRSKEGVKFHGVSKGGGLSFLPGTLDSLQSVYAYYYTSQN